jgi:hypothetical protein
MECFYGLQAVREAFPSSQMPLSTTMLEAVQCHLPSGHVCVDDKVAIGLQ